MKMKTLFIACLQLLACLAQAQMKQTPAPLWTQTVALKMTRTPGQTAAVTIEAVTPQSIVIAEGTGSLRALNTQTGETLWQREGHWQGTDARSAERGKGDAWSLAGTARGKDEAAVCLLTHAFSEITLNPHPNTFGVPVDLESSHFTFEGVEARTGQTLWQGIASAEGTGYVPFVRNGVLIRNRTGGSDYWDAATGKPLVLDTPEGRAQLRQILTRNGGSTLEREITFQAGGHALPDWPIRWLRSDTGTVETLTLPKEYGYIHVNLAQPLTAEGRMVLWVDMDNDMVGHSQDPKYLVGCDMQGRKLWQFPAKIEWQLGYSARTQVGHPVIIPGTGICLVDGYGLRVRDGKTLWKQTHRLGTPTGIYKEGGFAFNADFRAIHPDMVSVAYVEARTGAACSVLFGLPVYQIRVIGETLLVQTAPATFRAYAIPVLLAASRPLTAAAKPVANSDTLHSRNKRR